MNNATTFNPQLAHIDVTLRGWIVWLQWDDDSQPQRIGLETEAGEEYGEAEHLPEVSQLLDEYVVVRGRLTSDRLLYVQQYRLNDHEEDA